MTRQNGVVGRLYGVGVGPGDPELLTLQARRILSEVSVVCVPQTGAGEIGYAHSIVREFIDISRQELLELTFPMTKDRKVLQPHWEEAVEAIWTRLAASRDCAFITEGDPLLYSTFIYIYRLFGELHQEACVHIIPGISSVNAAAARALVPLADGDDRLAVLPATYEGEGLRAVLRSFDTIVLTKVHNVFDSVLGVLEEEELADRTVCVTHCTGVNEAIEHDIRSLKGKKLSYFSLLIVRR